MNIEDTRLIFLAAGQGKRMQPLGSTLPKSLLPVKDEPFVVRLLRQAVEHQATDLTVVVGYEQEQVRQAIRQSRTVYSCFMDTVFWPVSIATAMVSFFIVGNPSIRVYSQRRFSVLTDFPVRTTSR